MPIEVTVRRIGSGADHGEFLRVVHIADNGMCGARSPEIAFSFELCGILALRSAMNGPDVNLRQFATELAATGLALPVCAFKRDKTLRLPAQLYDEARKSLSES